MSYGKDMHLWIREGDAPEGPKTVNFEPLPSQQPGLDQLTNLLRAGSAVPLGVNISDPPNIWVARTTTPEGNREFQYNYVRADHDGWKDEIENWLNQTRPDSMENIWCALSGGRDFHMFAVPGNSENVYRLQAVPAAKMRADVSKMLDDGTGKPLGVNRSDPPEVWCVVTV